jgi:hypothetical protein
MCCCMWIGETASAIPPATLLSPLAFTLVKALSIIPYLLRPVATFLSRFEHLVPPLPVAGNPAPRHKILGALLGIAVLMVASKVALNLIAQPFQAALGQALSWYRRHGWAKAMAILITGTVLSCIHIYTYSSAVSAADYVAKHPGFVLWSAVQWCWYWRGGLLVAAFIAAIVPDVAPHAHVPHSVCSIMLYCSAQFGGSFLPAFVIISTYQWMVLPLITLFTILRGNLDALLLLALITLRLKKKLKKERQTRYTSPPYIILAMAVFLSLVLRPVVASHNGSPPAGPLGTPRSIRLIHTVAAMLNLNRASAKSDYQISEASAILDKLNQNGILQLPLASLLKHHQTMTRFSVRHEFLPEAGCIE